MTSIMKKRIQSVDILRLLFSVLVVLWHSRYLNRCGEHQLLLSDHAVEFFFLLSGYLMARHVEKPMQGTLGRDTWAFLKKKIGSFYPVYLIAFVLNVIIRIIINRITASRLSFSFFLWDILLLRETGLQGPFDTGTVIGSSWYLMAMILAMAILFPLLRKKTDFFLHVIAPLVSVLIYGWFSETHGNLYYTLQFENGISLGTVRAIADILMGCFCYTLCSKLKDRKIQEAVPVKTLITICELCCLCAVIYFSRCYSAGQTDFLCVVFIMIILVGEFGEISYLNRFCSLVRTGWIREFSLALYISHFTCITVVNYMNYPLSRNKTLLLYFGLAVIQAVCIVWIKIGIKYLWAMKTRKEAAG